MHKLPSGMEAHRVSSDNLSAVCEGDVRWSASQSLWFSAMTLGAVVGGSIFFSWSAVGLFFVTTAWVLLFGHSLGSHRKLIHDSYQCPRWLERILIYSGVLVGLAGPLGLLRQHELRDYAQRLRTCHDYLRHGQSFWVDAWWQLHCNLHLKQPPNIRIEKHLVEDSFLRFLEWTWMLQQLPWAVFFYWLGGWGFVAWGVCARVTAGVLGHWLIGYFAHNHGGMHFEVRGAAVQGRNIPLTSLLTMGECWHNNHHAYPGSARLGIDAGEWDPGWWALCMLQRVGLVWNIRLPEHLAARPELLPLDSRTPHRLDESSPGLPLVSRTASIRACLFPSAFWSEATSFHWPSAFASPRLLRILMGPAVDLQLELRSRRLSLRSASGEIRGLPAVCLGLARRSAPLRIVSVLLLPLAWLAEDTRRLVH
jgi:fatty-acid desaturase